MGDVKNIITDPCLGEVVDSYDEKDFGDGLMNVLNISKGSSDMVRDECRKLACEKFSFENIATEFLNLYNDLI